MTHEPLRKPGSPLRTALPAALPVLLLLHGCSLFSPRAWRDSKSVESSKGEVILKLSLDKEVCRPGEALIFEVTVENTTKKPIAVRPLTSASLSFWFGPKAEDRRARRDPVVGRLEAESLQGGGESPLPLEPGESRSRSFVLTRMTGEAGEFAAQVHMDAFTGGGWTRTGKLYSNAADFRVEGEPLFERDHDGLILMKDAIRVARGDAGAPKAPAEAVLVEDEAGFFKWWVNLAVPGASLKGRLVDPYLGRAKAHDPFDPSLRPESRVRINTGERPLRPALNP